MRFLADRAERLDRFLREALPGRRRRDWEECFARGDVRVNGRRGAKGQMLVAGDAVEISMPPPDAAAAHPDADLTIEWALIGEGAGWIAVSKPPATPTHPLRAGERGTMANGVAARVPACRDAATDPREGGAAHRLDANTTGALLFAKDRDSWLHLRAQFSAKTVRKTYLAIVHGGLATSSVHLTWPVAHDPTDASRAIACRTDEQALLLSARTAETRVALVASLREDMSLLRCETRTGRLHQVRVHLAAAGHPLWGDTLYGAPSDARASDGHFLHAEALTFVEPASQREVTVTAPLPQARAARLRGLGR